MDIVGQGIDPEKEAYDIFGIGDQFRITEKGTSDLNFMSKTQKTENV